MTPAEGALTPAQPKSEALRALYWRDEILQVMFWLRGEGFGDDADAPLIERFLGVDANIGVRYLDRLVEEGYLTRDTPYYRLTMKGIDEGGRIFSEEFAEFMRPAHGECGPDCWCHASADDAEACLAQRQAHEGHTHEGHTHEGHAHEAHGPFHEAPEPF